MRKIDMAAGRMRRNYRKALMAGLLYTLSTPALMVAIPSGAALAQAAPTQDVRYSTSASGPLPRQFADAIIASGNASSETLNVDGTSQIVYTALLSWYRTAMQDNGDVIVNKSNSYPHISGKSDPAWGAFVPRLAALSTTTGDWSVATLRFVAPANGVASLVSSSDDAGRDAIQARLAAFKKKIADLSANTQAGGYFSKARVPTDLAAVRQAMLDYGNSERKTVGFRRQVGATVATNIDSQPASIKAKDGLDEFVYANQPDMQFDEKLNSAAQFFAEALATGNGAVHDGPAQWQDPSGKVVSMKSIGDRFAYFQANGGAEIATGGAGGDAGHQPYSWMAGDTHYRWYWGVDGVYPVLGYGAAQDDKGQWYYVGTGRNTGTLCAAPPAAVVGPCIRRR